MVDVNYALVGANGDTIVFDYDEFILNPDFTGFGIPPAEVRIEKSAGDGGVFRHAKKGVRQVDLAVTILGDNRADVQVKLRRLSRLLQNSLGPTKLVANYTDNTSLELTGFYVGGAESQWGSNAGLIWNRWVISLQCPNPFWQSGILESFSIGSGGTGRGLLPQLSKLKVSSSSTLGVVAVNNAGDVPAFPTWTITGPVKNLVITNGIQQYGFSRIFGGETITVDTETATVTNVDGENQYFRLDPAPKLFLLPPGITGLNVLGDDIDLNFNVQLVYSPRFEVVH